MKLFRPDLESPGPDDLKVATRFMHVLPVGWVEPIDISNAVLFLASDESRYITGLPVTVDAGSMLK
jgi:NAD(P)-dependent dehydrogenase (short-subunit alcohol dehydrogenase family)